MTDGLKIGELARQAGVTTKAIRFYERKRVLPPATRAANRYRVYGPDAVAMVEFIKRASGLGLSLGDIKEIIAIRRDGRPPCAHVHRLLRNKAAELDHKVDDLLAVRRRIRQTLRQWKRRQLRSPAICGHIESVATPVHSAASKKP